MLPTSSFPWEMLSLWASLCDSSITQRKVRGLFRNRASPIGSLSVTLVFWWRFARWETFSQPEEENVASLPIIATFFDAETFDSWFIVWLFMKSLQLMEVILWGGVRLWDLKLGNRWTRMGHVQYPWGYPFVDTPVTGGTRAILTLRIYWTYVLNVLNIMLNMQRCVLNRNVTYREWLWKRWLSVESCIGVCGGGGETTWMRHHWWRRQRMWVF